ncbi:3-phosphoglycerate dehydrogenase [Siculibacillus lacustris]|uniref:3-phosphoglycerate dehydrogenase n=1 Tax=Siculibacillus lacustris TaxID=1549641 RepID=A0A4Q9VLB1_9HYPH|nr:NAD(P)-dependent oxidoreductase [Siculibacillus lacustris]TBW35364.1 3-phosphoglycerate dehydrogenase [Siculibacillus lacustris]
MKCLLVQPIHADGIAVLRTAGIDVIACPAADMETVARALPGCAAVITRNAGLSGPAMRAGDALRVVVVHGTGYDHVDMAVAGERGVLVCNTPGLNARSVAELALGLALAAARRIPAADRSERRGETGFREAERFVELGGKTALVVGWGAVGSRLGRMLAAGLGMKVLVHSRSAGDFERVATLAEGLARADLISLHTPLTPQTRGMIGAEALARVRPGALLVNTARAGLVDEVALAAAIDSGRIAAAALDDHSPGAPTGPLATSGRVIFTPHLGGTTEEALRRVAIEAARHVVTALSGGRPATALNDPGSLHP